MKIRRGKGTTRYGPGVDILLTGVEVALAIDAWLTAHDVHVLGPRTITVNGKLCHTGHVYVDPSGSVVAAGRVWSEVQDGGEWRGEHCWCDEVGRAGCTKLAEKRRCRRVEIHAAESGCRHQEKRPPCIHLGEMKTVKGVCLLDGKPCVAEGR